MSKKRRVKRRVIVTAVTIYVVLVAVFPVIGILVRDDRGHLSLKTSLPYFGLAGVAAVAGAFVLVMMFSPVRKSTHRKGSSGTIFPASWYRDD